MEWQPIETAPKDGAVALYYGKRMLFNMNHEPISLGVVRDLAERVEVGFCEDGDICEANTGHSVFEDHNYPDNVPTHWMPLPEPPADQ